MRLRVRATLLSFCLPSTANPHGANWPRVLVVAFASVCCVPLPAKASGNLQFGPPVHLVSNTPFSRPGGIALDETAKPPRLIVADTAHNTIQWADATDPTNLIFHSIPLANGFIDPEGLAVDTQGNLYVVNTLGNELRKFTWNGMTYQDQGNFCGTSANNVSISLPRDVAVDANGAVYLLDSGNRRLLKAGGPNAQAWSELTSPDPSWSNPLGLAVGNDMKVYVADTGNHRIVRLEAQTGKQVDTLGHWGTQQGGLRYPRDVAVDKDGRIFVADTYNHRVQVLDAKGNTLALLGQAPGVGMLEKIIVDSTYRIFAVDSDNNWILAFLGPKTKLPFDVFVRDDFNDKGVEPSVGPSKVASPDIIVRNKPDVDLALASKGGLENTYLSQDSHYPDPNYVYLELHNNGNQAANSNSARFYWYDPKVYNWDPGNFLGSFPSDWHFTNSFYTSWLDAQHNQPGNALFAPSVPPNDKVVVGPLIWLPPDPATAGTPGEFRLAVRVSNPFDSPPTGNPKNLIRLSNDISEIPVRVKRGPFPIGKQDTLIIPVNFSDGMLTPLNANSIDVSGMESSINTWLASVSYGLTSVAMGMTVPYTPLQTSGHYNDALNNPVISLMEEMLPVLLVKNPNLLVAANGQPIRRILLLTNDPNQAEWATNGSWHFTPAQIDLTVSIVAAGAPLPVIKHSIAHHFGLYDLYGHDPPYHFNVEPVGLWDTMAKFNDAHPLVWNKERAEWISGKQALVSYVRRPKAGTHPPVAQFDLFKQETAAPQQNVAVAIGLTPETPFLSETRFLYVEARTNKLNGDPDSTLPTPWLSDGVLMYYVDTTIPQGQGVVIIQDADPTKPNLVGATFIPGVHPSFTLPQAGLTVTVNSGQNGADYQIAVDFAPPAQLYDVYVDPGPVSWESPDIFVDIPDGAKGKHPGKYQSDIDPNPDHAVDEGEQAAMTDLNGKPLINHVYGRVHDKGGVDATQIIAQFYFAEPSNLGGKEAFNYYGFAPISGTIPDGKSRQVEFDWVPKLTGDSCARVELGGLGIAFDADPSDNAVNHNFDVQQSTSKSPFTAIDFPFLLSNDEAITRLVYFRADGIPKGWTWAFQPARLSLAPKQVGQGTLHLQPPNDAPVCTSQVVKVTSWMPTGDTMIRLGGSTLQVDLRTRTDLTLDTKIGPCESTVTHLIPTCAQIQTAGCTNPKEPNQLIQVEYTGPDGKPVFHDVMTDANGCFKDFLVVHEGDKWQVGAAYPGNPCDSKAQATRPVKVPLPTRDHPDRDVPHPFDHSCASGIAKRLAGSITTVEARAVPACGTGAITRDYRLQFEVTAQPGAESPSMSRLDGRIEISDLRLLAASDLAAGILTGRFRWKMQTMEAVGWVSGLSKAEPHRPQIGPLCSESWLLTGRWDLSLDGAVIAGADLGARVHAIVTLDLQPQGAQARVISASLEGIFEKDCDVQAARLEIDEVVQRAKADDIRPHPNVCGGQLPEMKPFSMNGHGRVSLSQVLLDRCKSSECKTDRTFSEFTIRLNGATPASPLADGVLTVAKFTQVFDGPQTGRGEHVGQFIYTGRDGTRVEGRMVGITHAGTLLEGRLVGTVVNGPSVGASVEARYSAQIAAGDSFVRDVSMSLGGWVLKGCLDALHAAVQATPSDYFSLLPSRPDPTGPRASREARGSSNAFR